MHSTVDLLVYAIPWTSYERKLLMLISKNRSRQNLSRPRRTEETGFIAPSVRYSVACYADRKTDPWRVCGAI